MKNLGAINSITKKYVSPYEANKKDNYICPDCNKKLIFRNGKINKPHFSHKSNKQCLYYDHPNESQIHKDAKLKLSNWLTDKKPLEIIWNCRCCKKESLFNSDEIKYKKNDNVIIEYRSKNNKFIADIAVLNNEKIKYIFEIKNTHETTTDVRPEPWYDINAAEIIDNLNSNRLTCIRQIDNGDRLCQSCINIIKKDGYETDEIYNESFTICVCCKSELGGTEENEDGLLCQTCAIDLWSGSIKMKKIKNKKKKTLYEFYGIEYGTILNCQYKDKDKVKSFGAKWDKNKRTWYVPKNISLYKFEKWLPKSVDFID